MAKTDQGTGTKFGRNLRGAVQSVLSVAMATTLTSVNPGHSFYSQTTAPAKNPTPTTTQPKPDAPVYGPDVDFYKLPLKYNWATQQKIKDHPKSVKKASTNPVILAQTSDANGKTTKKIYEGNPDKLYDIASVSKVISIIILDDLHKKKVIDLNKPVDADALDEYGINRNTTYRDAIAAAYYDSNNGVIQSALKSAIRADMKLDQNQPVKPEMVSEYLARYMTKEGFKQSALANPAGYPTQSDEFSQYFSMTHLPRGFNKYNIGELATFVEKKVCTAGLSKEVLQLINLRTAPPALSPPIDTSTDMTLLPSGVAQAAKELDSPGTRFILAKTGTSNTAAAGIIVKADAKNCQVTIGAGVVEEREVKIPAIARQPLRP